ncbi:hypothetical protein GGI09_005657 [Coemansia sp. S100]|nr:hypothetical protein GGI09_005657 [Coemansia sp. S100]
MLQDLRIGSGDPREVIYDNDNNAVTYPNLQHLQITNDRYFDPKDKVLAPGIVPFPKLKSLHILMDYVFADDVMFRGNSNTLEHLEFHVDEVMMDTMINSEEFKNVEFIMTLALACPKLCRITSFDPAAPNYRLGISEILESDGPYSKYAPRFRRLLKW